MHITTEPRIEPNAIAESIGTVIKARKGTFEVHTHDTVFQARRAVSCLVEPETGDVVIVKSAAILESSFIVDVLQRPSSTDTRIALDGNLTMELPAGRFTVAGKEGINLISNKSISAIADRIDVKARAGNVFLANATFIADTLSSTLNRLTQTAKRIYRRVTEIEHVQAEQIDFSVNGNLRMHGENTLITARELVKADGKQIHVG